MSKKQIKRVLISNRGEIALRGIKACKELDIKTIAIYSDVDANCLHVEKANEAVKLEGRPKLVYKDGKQIIQIAKNTGCDAIFVGYAFLSEEESFALACEENGIKLIGSNSDSIRRMGNKSESRIISAQENVPISRGSGRILTLKDAFKAIKSLSLLYPLKIMADRGGGGWGTKVAWSESELATEFPVAQQEGIDYANDPSVSIVEYIPNIRHIEVQILGDEYGNVIHLGTRDCSVQRGFQKLIEEAPARNLSKKLITAMQNDAIKLARAVKYVSAGTIEFIVFRNQYVFGEMNTRIQVEHSITEMVTGVDIVQEMILIASGEPLQYTQEDISLYGHSIECRINAENIYENFMPDPDVVTVYLPPEGPGIRVESHLYPGYRMPCEYDSLGAKLVVHHDKGRKSAIKKMIKALTAFQIEGIKTTIPFHLKALPHPIFQAGNHSTNFVENMLSSTPAQHHPPFGGAHGCFDYESDS